MTTRAARAFRLLMLLPLLLALAPAALRAQSKPVPVVLKLTLHDTIQPITADYLTRGLHDAADIHASAVLLSLGTPGGLLESTRTIVAAIEQSPVPVIVYISPPGSRAGSAGFFLLEAADIAAMAPGTNAGAAHPIVEGTKLDPIMKEKLENDTAAFLRSYVTRRGRNTQAAEDAVRNSKSYSDTEALQLKLIDLTAPDDASLLAALDGREIHRFDGSAITLHLTGAKIVTFAPSTRERLLSSLTNPDFAVLLLVLGGLLIYLEFNVPGTVVPGALGTLLVLLGFFGLNLLPVRHTAIVLLVAAVIMMALETKFASHGILALAGTLSLVFGLATLVDGPIAELRVHLGTAIGAGVGFGAISFGLAWIALRARRNKTLLGPQAMIGAQAVARTPLSPAGQIEIRGELWQATLLQAALSLPAGSPVRVLAVDGLLLIVEATVPR
ncbi:NfeD family protein [Granulicella arctica]|uniref:Membrane-bound serine protease (ClpP class) n=1 Tax=Granulicella arctica TaxID=940613 RepID=A0A7Y9PK54_9BACT|nr:nodulation protein NfeD [Granulicella arctica]NYF81331.1 membrane-bound serine protease (ClpP class) [Granulicella arctica]